LSLGAPSLIADFTEVMGLALDDYSKFWIDDDDTNKNLRETEVDA